MNDPDWRKKVSIDDEGKIDATELLDDMRPNKLTGTVTDSPASDDSAFTDVVLHQFADYFADHVFDAAYAALIGFCGEDEARKLAGEIVSRLKGKMGVE